MSRKFVAIGGFMVGFVAFISYADRYGLHLQNTHTWQTGVQEVRGQFPEPNPSQWSCADAKQSSLLLVLFTVWNEKQAAVTRPKRHEPGTCLLLMWERLHVHRETQQHRPSQERMQLLPGCAPCEAAEGEGGTLQRGQVHRVWVLPMLRRSSVPSPRPHGKGVHNLPHVRVGMAPSSDRDRQMRSPLCSLSC